MYVESEKETMDFFDVLSLIGGLCLFLFGMTVMGDSLEKAAGNSLKNLLGRLTGNKIAGFLTGLAVTAVIQSSSATTVMVVGFVNSGIMTLRQAINVIMGANVGTTVTAWILSLSGLESSNFFVKIFKPTSFTPILALIGIYLLMTAKSGRKKDVGMILLGFATLMYGMDAMSSAVAGLKEVDAFRNILVAFSDPVLGVLAGAALTAIIQSSSASVGILQALSSTGQITIGTSIPIIMGQNIGTCVTALISSVGTNRNARRASIVHLSFNVVGTVVWLALYCLLTSLFPISLLSRAASQLSIAVAHSAFNILCTLLMLPLSGWLEKLSYRLIPDPKDNKEEHLVELDERLMATPAIALDRCRFLTETMAQTAADSVTQALHTLSQYDPAAGESIRRSEKKTDHYQDLLSSYLLKLNTHPLSEQDSNEAYKLLFVINDFERISDHAVNILDSIETLHQKERGFTPQAQAELTTMANAVSEITDMALSAFCTGDVDSAAHIEPLEQVVDTLKAQLRNRHILRMKQGNCSAEAGFLWSDLITDMERVADHCSNIAGYILELAHDSLDVHEYLHKMRSNNSDFSAMHLRYAEKYKLPSMD